MALWRIVFGVYRYFFSPMIHALGGPGSGCRYEPSCSRYTEEAVRVWGWKGVWLGIKRLASCHPWSSRRDWVDPVPLKEV